MKLTMSEQGYCCDSCVKLIAHRSTDAARLWVELCEIHLESEMIISLVEECHPSLRTLEVLGFIITTENSQRTLAKVLGKITDETGTYYCGGECVE